MTNDADLLRQYATERSNPAFAELVHRHVDLVYSVALRKVGGDSHAARDVAQYVFIVLARKSKALTRYRTLTGWLYLTTHHRAAQMVRSERRRQAREHQAFAMNEICNTSDIDWHKLRPVLDDALQEMKERDREAILLRYFEQWSLAAIGSALHLTEDAARMRVDRALEKLRMLLVRRGVSSTAAALSIALGGQVAAAPAGIAAAISSTALAAVASTPAVAVLTGFFMNLGNIITGSIALTAVGLAMYEYNQASKTQNELAAARQGGTALRTQLADVASRLVQENQRSAVLQSQLDATRVSTASTRTEGKQPGKGAIVQAAPDDAALAAVERERKVSAEESQIQIDRTLSHYAPLFKKLALSVDQVDTFKALLVANMRRHGDIKEASRSQLINPADPDVQGLVEEADSELANQVRATFGETTYRAFKYFNDTGPFREFTDHVAAALASTSTPLAPEKAEQLVELLANNSRGPEGQVSDDPHALNFDAAVAQAQTLLSPPQLTALREVHEKQH